jgi:imidazolonepropionase-like amidohydrolase
MDRLRRCTWFVIVFCCVAGTLQAQQIEARQENQGPTLAVHAGRLIDVRTGKVSTNAYILVTKDRILAIADTAPAGVRVVDLSKYTVVPGLIDSHAHVLGDPKDQTSTSGLRMSSPQKAIWGVRNLQVWLDH